MGLIISHQQSCQQVRCKNSICPLVALLVPRLRFGSAAVIAIAAAGVTGVLVSLGLPNRAGSIIAVIAVVGYRRAVLCTLAVSPPGSPSRAPRTALARPQLLGTA